mgnify:CR=1 FL=1
MNTAVPGTRAGWRGLDGPENVLERHRPRREARRDQPASGLPGRHQREEHRADDQRQPSAVRDLQDVRAEERQVDRQENARSPAAPRPAATSSVRSRSTCSSTAVITIVSVTAMP